MTTTTVPDALTIDERDLLLDLAPVRAAGWELREFNEWLLCAPADLGLPDAGWKVHVSAPLGDYRTPIEAVRDVALRLGCAFKFMPTEERARTVNSKGMLRTASGKLACLYAVDADTLKAAVDLLRDRLRGWDGPDILTDLRCGPEPVFIRYGGIRPLWTYRRGGRVLGLRHPDGGVVPDEGRFRWTLPPWVELPAWAEPFLAQRQSRSMRLPCGIRKAVHFSAAGGVYIAAMRDTGEEVLVKEARPFAGLDDSGQDAVARLEHEHHWLRRLGARGVVPREYGMYHGSRHRYLVREMLDGETLAERMWRTWPWNVTVEPTDEALDDYVRWALARLDEVAALVDVVHEEGGAIHDLHPGNLFLCDDGVVRLFDLETFTEVDTESPPPVIAPEYLNPDGGDGYARDAYAYRVLAHALFSPTVLGWQVPDRQEQVRAGIAAAFGDRVLDEIDERTRGGDDMPHGFTVLNQPPPPVTPADLVEGFRARAETGELRGVAADEPGLGIGTAGLHLVDALHPACPATHGIESRLAELYEMLDRTQRVDPALSTGSSGIVLALLAGGAEADLDSWERHTLALMDEDVVEHDVEHGAPGVAVALWGIRRLVPSWSGGTALMERVAERTATVRPGMLGGVGLLQGDAGLGLFWGLLARLGMDDAAVRVPQFLATPPSAEEVQTLPGGLGGIGGWLTAWAAAPDQVFTDAVREDVLQVLRRPVFHKSGGLNGVAGTLLGLNLIAERVPEALAEVYARTEQQLGPWLGSGTGPGLSPYDPTLRRVDDTLLHGTAGLVLVDGLRRRRDGAR